MSGRNASVLLIAALTALPFFIAPAVHGETAPIPDSLAAALTTARPPETGVALSVNAENVQLPEGVKSPAPGSPVGVIADAYGRLIRSFGSVQAVAPSTTTILNTNPAAPNPYQDMPPSDVLRLLALSLNPAQWGQLTSQQGLGMDDLDDKQRLMFEALFPGGKLTIAPRNKLDSNHAQTLSADRILQSRLCLSQTVQIMLPVVGAGAYAYMGPSMPPKAEDPQEYTVLWSEPKTVGGIASKAEVPNVPKHSNLDYNAALFRTAIPLNGLKTVGDLVSRISRQTHTELYADSRLENLSLSIVGENRAAPADLLPALAFCVTGTFRNVGPAFVLTDDLVGLGTRRMILEALFDSVNQQQEELAGPIDSLALTHPLASLPLSATSLAITPDELKQADTGIRKFGNAGVTVHLGFEQLTPEQQRAAQSMFNASEALEQAGIKDGYFAAHPDREQHLSLDGKIILYTTPLLQLRVPDLDGVVNMQGRTDVDQLFQSLPAPRASRASRIPAPQPPPLENLKRYARRAVMVQPRTIEELDQIIAAMPAADMNEIWLIVPEPGEAVPTGKSASSTPGAAQLVDEALKRAGPAHIRVLPVVDLFYWGAAAPAADLDYTIRGETSAQLQKRKALEFERMYRVGGGPKVSSQEMVSPFAPAVETALDSLLKMVIRPGIAGMVWQTPSVPGYEPPEDPSGSGALSHNRFPFGDDPDYGYTIQARLRFLREKHTDPIDIGPPHYADIDLSLPFFGDTESAQLLLGEWDRLRAGVDLKVVQRLYATAQKAAAANDPAPFQGLPVLMPRLQNEYASWDDQRQLLSTKPGEASGTLKQMAGQVRRSSRIVFGSFGGWEISDPSRIASDLQHRPGADEWDGALFDLTPMDARPGVPAQSSLDLLTRLTADLRVQQKAGP